MELVRLIDSWLNKITMYRLLVYGLSSLLIIAMGLGELGYLSISSEGIALSLVTLIIVCYVATRSLATLSGAPANSESWLITALILCCILPPATTVHRVALVALAGLLAMASKYILVYRHKLLCNPAAFAALVLSVGGLLPATWWIG